MGYGFDRKFTDTVHKNLTSKIIYPKLNWEEQDIDEAERERIDMEDGVDYVFTDNSSGETVNVQERFREEKYRVYTDFTIRYEREFNRHADRKFSEFYKIIADYMVYGTINSTKKEVEKATGFIKYGVIDLRIIKRLLDSGEIIIDRSVKYKCVNINGKIHCPVNYNGDGSSSFIPIDIVLLKDLHPEAIVMQQGFY